MSQQRFAKFLLDRIYDHIGDVPEPTATSIKLHLDELRGIMEGDFDEPAPSRRSRKGGGANA